MPRECWHFLHQQQPLQGPNVLFAYIARAAGFPHASTESTSLLLAVVSTLPLTQHTHFSWFLPLYIRFGTSRAPFQSPSFVRRQKTGQRMAKKKSLGSQRVGRMIK